MTSAILSKRGTQSLNVSNIKTELFNKICSSEKEIINLGVAENTLCEDLVLERFNESGIQETIQRDLYYGIATGSEGMRSAVAGLLNERLCAVHKLMPEHMVITNGVTGALDLLAHCIADPDDYFLSPTPMYPNIHVDTLTRSGVSTLAVPMEEVDSQTNEVRYILTVGKLEKVYNEAVMEGKVVRGIILINPHNPTGQIFDRDLVQRIIDWAATLRLHIIFDEIYALSVFEGRFESSVTQVTSITDPNRTHFVWGLSKDFGLSGLRVGVIHSWSSGVVQCLQRIGVFSMCPSNIQRKIEVFLTDKAWLNTEFFPVMYQRMRKNRDMTSTWLKEMGIPHNQPTSALFIWADFREYVTNRNDEKDLFEAFLDAGVYVDPASLCFFSTVPGFFRILFTVNINKVKRGLDLMKKCLPTLKGSKS